MGEITGVWLCGAAARAGRLVFFVLLVDVNICVGCLAWCMSDSVEIEERREEIAAALGAEGIDLDVLDQMDTEVVLERIGVALAKHDVAKYWVSLPFSFSFLVHLDLYTVSGGGDTPSFRE